MVATRLRVLRTGTVFHRIHRSVHGPIYFGPPGNDPVQRYDAPDGSYKTLYMARSLETAFGETLVRLPTIMFVPSTSVEARRRSELRATRPLRLYPLVDASVSADGLSFSDLQGDSYSKTWQVSGRIHATTLADGILYTSRFDNQQCVALFDRAATAIEEARAKSLALPPEDAIRLCAHFGKEYVEP